MQASLIQNDFGTANHEQIWVEVQSKIAKKLGNDIYNSWIKPLAFSSSDGDEIILSAPTRFIREWVIGHYQNDIARLWQEETSAHIIITIKHSNNSVVQNNPVTKKSDFASIISAKASSANSAYNNEDNKIAHFPVDSRYNFQNFIVGASNNIAYAACKAVADASTAVQGANPLYIYGNVGLGKTHLLQAIASQIKISQPNRKVLYLSAERFMFQFISSLRRKDIINFKEEFRDVDILLIDDLQFICGKQSTMEEFLHTFNTLIDAGKQVILAADRSPHDLKGVDERLRSRLAWGLSVAIKPADIELRQKIIKNKTKNQDIEIPVEVQDFLSTNISNNIRELEGALNRIAMHAKLSGASVNIDLVKEILVDVLRGNQKQITIDDIKDIVSKKFNINSQDMQSSRRARAVARPRQMAMYLAKKLTTYSLPEIGRQFGGKDHTTVMHAVKRISELMENDPIIEQDITSLRRELQSL